MRSNHGSHCHGTFHQPQQTMQRNNKTQDNYHQPFDNGDAFIPFFPMSSSPEWFSRVKQQSNGLQSRAGLREPSSPRVSHPETDVCKDSAFGQNQFVISDGQVSTADAIQRAIARSATVLLLFSLPACYNCSNNCASIGSIPPISYTSDTSQDFQTQQASNG
jgi:hypothetical protein